MKTTRNRIMKQITNKISQNTTKMLHYFFSKMNGKNKNRNLERIDITNHKSNTTGKYEATLFFLENGYVKTMKMDDENLDILINKMSQFIKDKN